MLRSLLSAITAPPAGGLAEAQRHLDSLTKPPGSLGRLEELAARLAVLAGGAPRVERPHIFTFAADHGVVAEGVSAYPQIVTAQMVENFLRGGAAVNVLARQAEARVVVADFGVANPIPGSPWLHSCPIAPGTANLARGPAVTLAPDARHALFASHRSAEPGHAVILEHLGLTPYLDLALRLGEGTGAALFIHLARAAARIWREMATFKSAGVSDKR